MHPSLQSTRCAICDTEGNARELYPANFRLEDLTPAVFSARRLPDRLHYRMVRCNTCGLVRSDPIAMPAWLEHLYARSAFTYAGETSDLRCTYGRHLARLERFGARKGSLLEIGCGNGFFLGEALAQGYAGVRGVEPSEAAVNSAPPGLRERILRDVLRPGLFEPEQFNVICIFQALDHMPDPGGVLRECRRLLKPGGLLLAINHNAGAFSARLLGALSPIVDIEHTYLYSLGTMRRLFIRAGFEVCRAGPLVNRFPVRYLARLAPLPGRLKRSLLPWLERTSLGRLRLSLPLGNLYLVARKLVEPMNPTTLK